MNTVVTVSGVQQSDSVTHTLFLKSVRCVSDSFVTPWTVAPQAPLSMGFSRQEYWSGLLFPPPGDLPNPGIDPRSPALLADSLSSEPPGKSLNHSQFTSVPLSCSVMSSSL